MKRFIIAVAIAGMVLSITNTVLATTPDIKANNSDSPITLGTNDTLSITVGLSAEENAGANCDWWILWSVSGNWYYYSLVSSWTSAGNNASNLSTTHQGALFDFSSFAVLNTSGLPEGTHTFYFAIDTNMNGTIDINQLYFDGVSVSITSDLSGSTYDLTVTKDGTGNGSVLSTDESINCGNACTESYTEGTVVTLTATPDSGSAFTGWTGGGCSGTDACVVAMNNVATVTATFGQTSIAAPDPEYNDITWTLPTGASELRLSLPVDINDIYLGSIGGFGLHSGGHIEGLDHVWIHITKGTPVRSWQDGYVEDVRLSGMVELGEYAITINYGQNLVGIHMEVEEPLVEKYTNVTRGQIIGYGMTFGGDDSSAEFGLIDKGRSDGVEAWDGGVYVSPFDYLNDDDKKTLVDAYKTNVLGPYIENGEKPSGWEWEPYEPYLTNSIFIHQENKISGVWYLISENWESGYPNDILTFIEANNPYYVGNVVFAEDDTSEGDYDIKGTCEIDYDKGQVEIQNTRGPNYFGIFEIDESGERAELRIEYQEGSFPAAFTGNALTYIQRSNLSRREDATQLGVLD